MMQKTTRRRVLVSIGAIAAAAGAGLAVGAYSQISGMPYRSWLKSRIRANLPGVQISDEVLDAFVEDFAGRYPPRRLHRVLVLADGRADWLAEKIGFDSPSFELLERRVLTQFLFATDFFELQDPMIEPVRYFGLRENLQCMGRNPFATFVDA